MCILWLPQILGTHVHTFLDHRDNLFLQIKWSIRAISQHRRRHVAPELHLLGILVLRIVGGQLIRRGLTYHVEHAPLHGQIILKRLHAGAVVGAEVHVVDEKVPHRGAGLRRDRHIAIPASRHLAAGQTGVIFPLGLFLRLRYDVNWPQLAPTILNRRQRLPFIQ